MNDPLRSRGRTAAFVTSGRAGSRSASPARVPLAEFATYLPLAPHPAWKSRLIDAESGE
ncbi:hypothetical protein FTUN_6857 [Frigoriglobus tundricola]|uniref:Uncharacterized protein n=1 Tax=Frigoriglobus tundricola TaxID=2774151 RepID=A0A6M5YZ69_9BACT|nr:hypothetical protein FTUN_6857 [Frigoriglobus tundricola]